MRVHNCILTCLSFLKNNHYSPCTITQVIDLNNVLFLMQLREVMSHPATTLCTYSIYGPTSTHTCCKGHTSTHMCHKGHTSTHTYCKGHTSTHMCRKGHTSTHTCCEGHTSHTQVLQRSHQHTHTRATPSYATKLVATNVNYPVPLHGLNMANTSVSSIMRPSPVAIYKPLQSMGGVGGKRIQLPYDSRSNS